MRTASPGRDSYVCNDYVISKIGVTVNHLQSMCFIRPPLLTMCKTDLGKTL